MDALLASYQVMIEGGMLAAIRVLALLLATPMLRDRALPMQVRLLISALVAILVVPVVPLPEAPADNMWQLLLGGIGEAAVGLCIGFVLQLLLEGLRIAGEVMEIQVGLSFNLGDPNDPLGPTLTAQMYYLMAGMLFWATGVYRVALSGLADSFHLVPVGSVHMSAMLAAPDVVYSTPNVMDYAAAMFIAAVKIAAPVVMTMLVTTFVFGLVARTMPQLNIFIVSYPLRIVLGLGMVMVGMSLVAERIIEYYSGVPGMVSGVVRYFVAAQPSGPGG